MIFHSVASLAKKSTASSKTSSPQSAIFHIPVSLRFFNVIKQLLTSSFLSSRPVSLSFYLSFNNTFWKAARKQYVNNLLILPHVIVRRMFLLSLTLHFTHDQSS